MKKAISIILALVLVLGLCTVLAGCGSKSGNDADKVYEFTLSMHDAKTTANAIYMQSWIDKVAAATDGHVKITLHDGATLSAATDIGDNVKAGAVDIGWLYTSYYAGQFPLSDVINLPMQGFGDPIVSTEVLWALSEKYEQVEGEWGDFKLLMLYGNPGMIFASGEKPITSVADLKGLTVRCPSGAITDVLSKWGASPVTMAPPDLYEAIEKKNINAYIFEPAGICNFSLHEITKYYTDLPLYDGPFALIMNKAQWDSLPEEYQKAIDNLSGKAASIAAAQAFADDVAAKSQEIVAAGGEFVTVSDEAKAEFAVAANEYAQTWIENMSKDGFDAAAYLADAKAFAEEFSK
ncbi:MAG: TRAP transporter substrate-binding protein [Oscillospiraceae bacterium]|nr:TRAP transporter substrate-binding protein [Oscillospiraceae bacterium]